MRVKLTKTAAGETVFALHHSDTYNCITLERVFSEIKEFFEGNPRETVVMRIKKELPTDPAVYDTIQSALQKLFYKFPGLVYAKNVVPRLY